jgi:CO/xanthine dehydrogenase FAD-binding subunit
MCPMYHGRVHPLAYEAPRSLEAAVSVLAKHGSDARVLAGGTDLLVQMRSGLGPATTFVDVKGIPELGALRLGPDGLHLGAAVSCWELSRKAELLALYPGLMEAAALIGSMQIQGRASVGGNLCNGSPAADTVPALIALSATCRIAGPEGRRDIPAQDFVRAPGRTVLGSGEILVEIFVPRPPPRSADAYLRFIPRSEMDIAVVGCGAFVELDPDGVCQRARVALGAVAPRPILVPELGEVLTGTRLESSDLERAAAVAQAAGAPIGDRRGSAAYRRRLAGVLTRRAVSRAAKRARGDAPA